MSKITTQLVKADGTAPTFAAAAAGDLADCGTGVGLKLIVRNAAGSSMTVTIAIPGTQVGGVANDANVFTVPATTGEKWIPLYGYYADPSDTLAHITYSSVTSVTRAVVKG